MSPELYKKLQGKDKARVINSEKNDLFALGLTVLSIGNQDSHQDCYKPNGEFDEQKLNKYIANFDSKYGDKNPMLTTVVRTLLAVNDEDRPNTESLQENMISYEEYKRKENNGDGFSFSKSENINNVQNQMQFQNTETKVKSSVPNSQKQTYKTENEETKPIIINKSEYKQESVTQNVHSFNQPQIQGIERQQQELIRKQEEYENYVKEQVSNIVWKIPN